MHTRGRPQFGYLQCVVALLGALGWAGAACAQAVDDDPTRPAPEWLAAQPPAPGAPVAADGAANPAAGAAAAATVGARVLVIGRTRKFAIVDGQVLKPGQLYNGSKVIGINPGGVVLQKDGSKEILRMSPAVEKRIIKPQPLANRGSR